MLIKFSCNQCHRIYNTLDEAKMCDCGLPKLESIGCKIEVREDGQRDLYLPNGKFLMTYPPKVER